MNDLVQWRRKIASFVGEAQDILGKSEGAYVSRAFNAHESLKRVGELSFEQADSLKQAVRCVEADLHKAAIVMAWTALADLLYDYGGQKIHSIQAVRPKWKCSDRQTLCEDQGDYAIISALKEAKCISKADMKSLHGLLHQRNQCAHPSDYFPTPNQALGYIDAVISEAGKLLKKIVP